MTTQSKSVWGTWQQTRNTLVQTLSLNIELRNAKTPGTPEEQALNQNIDQNIKDMQAHALNGLRQIDEAVLNSNLAAQLTKASKAAKTEANRIRKATKRVGDLTSLTGKLTSLVTGIRGL